MILHPHFKGITLGEWHEETADPNNLNPKEYGILFDGGIGYKTIIGTFNIECRYGLGLNTKYQGYDIKTRSLAVLFGYYYQF
jgi:hypothetical protein